MKIQWFGQSCMVIESLNGTKILCDPYDDSVGYRLPDADADIVTVSHNHFDHNAVDIVKGNPYVIRETGEFEHLGIKIKGITTFHDDEGGSKRGINIVFKFVIDNINFLHLGDVGHKLSDEHLKEMSPCDILAVPVGGVYTVDGVDAFEIARQLNPQIIIPVHYDTPSNKVGLNSAADFESRFPEIRRVKFWEGSRKDLPERVVVYTLMALGEVN